MNSSCIFLVCIQLLVVYIQGFDVFLVASKVHYFCGATAATVENFFRSIVPLFKNLRLHMAQDVMVLEHC